MRLQAKAEELAARGLFLGGPVGDFETAGRLQLIALLRAGLHPDSKVVDIGCGCLRGGYWLIHFLDPGRYFGIEPASDMLEAGLTELLEKDVIALKGPRFDTNSHFDTSVFGERFDYFLARSVWTHASKPQIELMLDSFVRDSAPGGVFLTSYLPAVVPPGLRRADGRSPPRTWKRTLRRLRRRVTRLRDFQRNRWSRPRVRLGLEWVQQVCEKRGLSVSELAEDRFNEQVWLRITRADR